MAVDKAVRVMYNIQKGERGTQMKEYYCRYSCTPSCDMKKSCMAVSGCFIGAISMFAASGIGGRLAHCFVGAAIVWLYAGFLIGERVLTRGYVYSIVRDPYTEKDDLVIHRLHLGRSSAVCRIALESIRELSEYDPIREKKKAALAGKRRMKKIKRPRPDLKTHRSAQVYDYCADIIPARYCLIRTETEGYIRFTPDDTMIEIIKQSLSPADK